MINYSIVMKSVNSNLIEINQAKGRINEAKKNNQQPAEADLALVATEKQHAYAIAQYAEVMDINRLAKHIASHGCVYSRADIQAILNMTVDCIREQLLEGRKIRLGDMGDFSVSLTSKGAETADKFTSQNITDVRVVWEPASDFKNLMADAEFNLVASRSAQAAVMKAIKSGSNVVDLSGANASDSDGGGNGGGNDGGTNGNGGGTTPTPAAKKRITLAASPSAGGTVTGAGEYEVGATATLKAVPNSGYTFSQWSDGVTQASRNVVVSADLNLTAQFTEQQTPPASGGDDDDFTLPGE